jgi:hypothetical protein
MPARYDFPAALPIDTTILWHVKADDGGLYAHVANSWRRVGEVDPNWVANFEAEHAVGYAVFLLQGRVHVIYHLPITNVTRVVRVDHVGVELVDELYGAPTWQPVEAPTCQSLDGEQATPYPFTYTDGVLEVDLNGLTDPACQVLFAPDAAGSPWALAAWQPWDSALPRSPVAIRMDYQFEGSSANGVTVGISYGALDGTEYPLHADQGGPYTPDTGWQSIELLITDPPVAGTPGFFLTFQATSPEGALRVRNLRVEATANGASVGIAQALSFGQPAYEGSGVILAAASGSTVYRFDFDGRRLQKRMSVSTAEAASLAGTSVVSNPTVDAVAIATGTLLVGSRPRYVAGAERELPAVLTDATLRPLWTDQVHLLHTSAEVAETKYAASAYLATLACCSYDGALARLDYLGRLRVGASPLDNDVTWTLPIHAAGGLDWARAGVVVQPATPIVTVEEPVVMAAGPATTALITELGLSLPGTTFQVASTGDFGYFTHAAGGQIFGRTIGGAAWSAVIAAGDTISVTYSLRNTVASMIELPGQRLAICLGSTGCPPAPAPHLVILDAGQAVETVIQLGVQSAVSMIMTANGAFIDVLVEHGTIEGVVLHVVVDVEAGTATNMGVVYHRATTLPVAGARAALPGAGLCAWYALNASLQVVDISRLGMADILVVRAWSHAATAPQIEVLDEQGVVLQRSTLRANISGPENTIQIHPTVVANRRYSVRGVDSFPRVPVLSQAAMPPGTVQYPLSVYRDLRWFAQRDDAANGNPLYEGEAAHIRILDAVGQLVADEASTTRVEHTDVALLPRDMDTVAQLPYPILTLPILPTYLGVVVSLADIIVTDAETNATFEVVRTDTGVPFSFRLMTEDGTALADVEYTAIDQVIELTGPGATFVDVPLLPGGASDGHFFYLHVEAVAECGQPTEPDYPIIAPYLIAINGQTVTVNNQTVLFD